MDNLSYKSFFTNLSSKRGKIREHRRVSRGSTTTLTRWCRYLLVVMLLGAGVTLLHRPYVKWTANSLLETATREESLGHLRKAAEALEAYVRLMPDDIELLARFGVLCTRLGDSNRAASYKALRILERVLWAEPQRHDIRRKVAGVALRLGLVPQAKEHLETLLRVVPEDGEAESLLGECQIALKQYQDAAIWFDRACKHAPDRIKSYVHLAYLLKDHIAETERELLERKLGRWADQVMNEMVAANPRSARAYLERARYRRRFGGSLQAVEDDLARAYALAPDDVDVILARAGWAADNRRTDEARDYLQRGARLYPRNITLSWRLASLELQANRAEAAIRDLRQAVACSPEERSLAWTFADLLIQTGEIAEAEQIVSKLRDDGAVSSRRVGYLEAGLLMRQGEWVNAAAVFEISSSAHELKGQANCWLSYCYKQLGDLDRQLTTNRMLVDLEPQSARHRFELGLTLLALSRVDDAIDQFQEVTKFRPNWVNAWILLARSLILRELRVQENDRKWLAIEDVLKRADRAVPDSSLFQITRAETFEARRQLDVAHRVLEEARAKWPDRVECWVALAGMALRLRRPAEALATLDEAQGCLGDSVDIRLGRARYWAVQPIAEAPDALMAQAHDITKFSQEDRRRLLDGLAVTSYRLGLSAQAERLWGQIADKEPRNLRLRVLLFELASRVGNRASMNRIIEDIRRACEYPPQLARTRTPVDDPARDAIRERFARLTAPGSAAERTQLLEAYISDVERTQEWAIKLNVGISIVYLANPKKP